VVEVCLTVSRRNTGTASFAASIPNGLPPQRWPLNTLRIRSSMSGKSANPRSTACERATTLNDGAQERHRLRVTTPLRSVDVAHLRQAATASPLRPVCPTGQGWSSSLPAARTEAAALPLEELALPAGCWDPSRASSRLSKARGRRPSQTILERGDHLSSAPCSPGPRQTLFALQPPCPPSCRRAAAQRLWRSPAARASVARVSRQVQRPVRHRISGVPLVRADDRGAQR
jgi:hypothetical protein